MNISKCTVWRCRQLNSNWTPHLPASPLAGQCFLQVSQTSQVDLQQGNSYFVSFYSIWPHVFLSNWHQLWHNFLSNTNRTDTLIFLQGFYIFNEINTDVRVGKVFNHWIILNKNKTWGKLQLLMQVFQAIKESWTNYSLLNASVSLFSTLISWQFHWISGHH